MEPRVEYLFGCVILVAVVVLGFEAAGLSRRHPVELRYTTYCLFFLAGALVTPFAHGPLDILALALPSIALFEIISMITRTTTRA